MKNMSINKKISLIILLMVVLSTAVVGIFSYIFYRRDSVAVSADKALAIAQSVASAIDGGQFREIMLSGEKNEYWDDKKQYIDEVMARTDVAYLYLLDKNYDENVKYFMEAASTDELDSIDLCEEESIEFHADEVFETLKTGKPTVTGIYSAEDYGIMVSGFAPILDNGETVGVVGIDISINDVMAASNVFAVVIIACVLVCSTMFWLISHLYIKRKIGIPITVLSDAAGMLSKGSVDIKLSINSGDEIGILTAAFLDIMDSTEKQIAVLERLADGDLTVDVTPRSDMDSMSFAIKKTVSNLNNMFSEINNTATEVSQGSERIANGSQLLAQGATEQTTALKELSDSLSDITQKNDNSTELAGKAAKLANEIILNAEKGNRQMNEMMKAVGEINKAGQQIKKVIKVIDDIAFQTNILALNAAVEAARAGQHGKGFAVVAEEVRNLASKSAEAAKDTEGLIANSVAKAELGSSIASETVASLAEIVAEINDSNKLIMDIVGISGEQAKAIAHINMGIEQVSQVVGQNNMSAAESATASEEMRGQAGALEGLVARFKLR